MSPSLDAPGWAPIPDVLTTGEGTIDLCAADLDRVDDGVTAALSAAERERAAGMVKERDARRWRRARGLLRSVLARYLGADARELEIVTSHGGKPGLDGAEAARLRFSVSRSDRFALLALAADREVGVDVEARGRPLRELAIARRAFPDEVAGLTALEGEERRREFLRLWVRHEAQVKCLRTGLSRSPSAAQRRALWTAEVELGTGISAAVAAHGDRPRELRRWLASR